MIRFRDLLDIDESCIVAPQPEIKKKNKKNFKEKTPWVDKYRPSKLNEIVYQDEVINMLKETLKTGNLQHLLFYGPPGTGKTSTILAISRELFGPKVFRDRVIELNASDERGINVVRKKIVSFAKSAIGSRDKNYLCPPYKIIILDEADAMTTEAQSALRKTMEDSSKITRFCFICNYINQIIEPITSRCAKFRFKSLSEKSILDKLEYISKNEKLNISRDSLKIISNISGGDMRSAIMILQNLQYINTPQKEICPMNIYEIANCIDDSQLQEIKKICIMDKKMNAVKIVKLAKKVRSSGYPIYNLLDQIHQIVINSKKLSDNVKSIICIHFARTEKRLIDGADEYLQLLSVLMCIRSASLNIKSVHHEI
jgi:replication factor C subunit 2/4